MKQFFGIAIFIFLLVPLCAQSPVALDASFADQGKLVLPQSRTGDLVGVFPDESLLLVGNPMSSGYASLTKVKPDGSTDQSFGNGGSFTLQLMEKATRISDLIIAPEAIYLCGSTTTDVGGTQTYAFVASIELDGSGFYTSFAWFGEEIFQSPKIRYFRSMIRDDQGNFFLLGSKTLGEVNLVKLTSDGQIDPSFANGGHLSLSPAVSTHWYDATKASLCWHPDGDLLLAFTYMRATSGTNEPNFNRMALAKANSSGILNSGFAQNGIGFYSYDSTSYDKLARVHARPNGDILYSGMSWTGFDYDYLAIGLRADGSLNPNFGQQGKVKWDLNGKETTEGCYNSLLLPDGRLLLTGNHGSGDTVYFALAMLDAQGQPDQHFHAGGYFKHIFNENNNSSSSGAVLSPAGKVVLTGYTRTCSNGVCGILKWCAARYQIPAAPLGEDKYASSPVVYPNPVISGGTLHLPWAGNWWIGDVSGRGQWLETQEGKEIRLPIGLRPGVYLVQHGQQGKGFQLMVE